MNMECQHNQANNKRLSIINQYYQDCLASETIKLPQPSIGLDIIFSQLKIYSKQRLDTFQPNLQGFDNQQIKGLKFISSKLAKLFIKNRKLPYNQISKILIDNFASQQKDQRNIKRRVYDAINVLVAAGILIKKNNFIQMVREKIKTKNQNLQKNKLQEQIQHVQNRMQVKQKLKTNLVQKHKLIKKLFDRNAKVQRLLTFNLKKSDLKNKMTKKNQLSSESLDLIKYQKKIPEPGVIFILKNKQISVQSNKKMPSIIKRFNQPHSIEISLTYSHKNNNQNKMQIQEIQQNQDQNGQCLSQLKEGSFSLLDLLIFLSLDNQ